MGDDKLENNTSDKKPPMETRNDSNKKSFVDRLTVISGFVATIAAIIALWPILFPPPPPPPPPPTTSIRLCTGEYERACDAHDAYAYCYTDINAWAAQRCQQYSFTRIGKKGGNKCGYDVHMIACTGPK